MANKKIKYVDLILPVPLPNLYTYETPEEYENELEIGMAVIVQFGRKKLYSGIIKNIHSNKPNYKTKSIIDIVSPKLIITEKQLKLWDWISEYYMAFIGDIYNAAVPSGLKLESETLISLTEDIEELELTEDEKIIVSNLKNSKKPLLLKDISELLEKTNIINIVNKLLDKNIITINEKLKTKYKPKTIDFIHLNPKFNNENSLNEIFDSLTRAPKQYDILTAYISISGLLSNKNNKVTKAELIHKSKANNESLKVLVKKDIFIIDTVNIDRISVANENEKSFKTLNTYQTKAISETKQQFNNKDVVLLHGITGSGKTEIYIELINEQINKGKQVLYLLPEIAITSQIINRLRIAFGDVVGVYHSKFSNNERVEIYRNTFNNNKYKIILGVRSSIFLPFSNLGLIIVDEEHETTYKQFHPAPRYNARDTAMVLANLHNAKVLLGTATPSIETYYNAKAGKYGFVELKNRYGKSVLPKITVYDIKDARKKNKMKSLFSPLLVDKISTALENKKQIILFQNRRGFAPYIECKECGWVPYCENCDVSLTYHKHSNKLTCHYCGYTLGAINKCNACGDTNIITKGFGTEKIEDEISILFPKAKIARMDLDTTHRKNAHEEIIKDFEDGKVDILTGTQMVSKGLDFKNVSIVGVINADDMLNFPDFRAFEKSFQLLTQVAGRAGRTKDQGEVIIQTSTPAHKILNFVINNNYEAFFENELADRNEFNYPPYYKLLKLTIKHKRKDILNVGSNLLAIEFKNVFGDLVLGPEDALISRVQNFYIKEILIKVKKGKSLKQSKAVIFNIIEKIKSDFRFKYLIIIPDVDNY